jgi:hypothetical protein
MAILQMQLILDIVGQAGIISTKGGFLLFSCLAYSSYVVTSAPNAFCSSYEREAQHDIARFATVATTLASVGARAD